MHDLTKTYWRVRAPRYKFLIHKNYGRVTEWRFRGVATCYGCGTVWFDIFYCPPVRYLFQTIWTIAHNHTTITCRHSAESPLLRLPKLLIKNLIFIWLTELSSLKKNVIQVPLGKCLKGRVSKCNPTFNHYWSEFEKCVTRSQTFRKVTTFRRRPNPRFS